MDILNEIVNCDQNQNGGLDSHLLEPLALDEFSDGLEGVYIGDGRE